MSKNTYAPTDGGYLTAVQVRARYGGRSDMWLWRRLEADPHFPKPMRVSGYRYWRLSELLKWEEQNAKAS
jgi:predicted DNA-binding transcriptional regulator AlpA